MDNLVLKQVTKYIVPCIQLFGIYVILNGHISPGGGFAGGTIIASSIILKDVALGKASINFNQDHALKLICISLMTYGILKGYSFLSDTLHLPHPPIGTPGHILSGGFLLPLNILIGITVTSTIFILYDLFSLKN
ncbi:MAG: MnhB domain-containing protein [Clostridia bacterium]|nr:MnhB domain-containing protein [Clostridia bacterium]